MGLRQAEPAQDGRRRCLRGRGAGGGRGQTGRPRPQPAAPAGHGRHTHLGRARGARERRRSRGNEWSRSLLAGDPRPGPGRGARGCQGGCGRLPSARDARLLVGGSAAAHRALRGRDALAPQRLEPSPPRGAAPTANPPARPPEPRGPSSAPGTPPGLPPGLAAGRCGLELPWGGATRPPPRPLSPPGRRPGAERDAPTQGNGSVLE